MQENRCCFIIPYFGKLVDTFPVFLKTYESNPDFMWLLLTNDKTIYPYPDNVKVKYCEFDDLKRKIQNCFEFDVVPYKSRFVTSMHNWDTEEWYVGKEKNNIIVWENGHTYAVNYEKRMLQKKEIIYAHIQKRKLRMNNFKGNMSVFLILQNEIISYEKFLSETKLKYILLFVNLKALWHLDELKYKLHSSLKKTRHRINKLVFMLKSEDI